MSIWIAEVRASERIERKIREKHGVTLDEVKEAVLCGSVGKVRKDISDVRGVRYLAQGTTTTGRKLKIVLFPVDFEDGIFALGTAFQA